MRKIKIVVLFGSGSRNLRSNNTLQHFRGGELSFVRLSILSTKPGIISAEVELEESQRYYSAHDLRGDANQQSIIGEMEIKSSKKRCYK